MNRVVIIGPSGAGKTTLARELRSLLHINVFHLDRLFWNRDWQGKSRGMRIDTLRKVIREKQWIIEGNYPDSSVPALDVADTIIFLDMSPLLCLVRVIQRHLKFYGRSRCDIPEGCTDRLTLSHMLKILIFPVRGRRKFDQKLRNCDPACIIRLRSRKAVGEFLAQQQQKIERKQKSASAASPVKIRSLVGNVR